MQSAWHMSKAPDTSEDERVALAACEALLSRLYGRPAQQIDASIRQLTDIGRAHLQVLQELEKRRQQGILELSASQATS